MPKASRVAESSTSTSSVTVTLGGPIVGRRSVASKHSVGETGIELVIEDTAGNWLEGVYTLTSVGPTVMTRTAILASSNSDADVTFPSGAKIVSETASATFLNNLPAPSDIAFTTTVPLTNTAGAYMPTQTVSGALAFNAAAGAVRGAYTTVGLVADGVNVPTFPGFTEHGSSTGYDNRAQYLNIIQFFFVAGTNWWANSQAATPTAVPSPATGISLAGPTSGVVNIASSNFTVAFTPVGGTNSGSVTVTPTPVTGVTFSPTSVTISTGSSATFTATSGTTGAKSIAVTNNGGLTNPTAITWTVAAAATAPAQMAAPTATGGDTTASVAMTAPYDGGSAITGYTVTSSPAGMTDSNAGATSLTHTMTGGTNGTAYTFTARANNSVGTSPASPASNSVTLATVVATPRLTALNAMTEAGTGPYSYTGTNAGGAGFLTKGGVLNLHLPSSGNGSFALRNTSALEFIMAVTSSASATSVETFSTCPYAFWTGSTGGNYTAFSTGVAQTALNTLAPAANDIMRLRRAGNTLTAEVARAASPTTFTAIYTWPGVTTGTMGFEINALGCTFDTLTCVGMS